MALGIEMMDVCETQRFLRPPFVTLKIPSRVETSYVHQIRFDHSSSLNNIFFDRLSSRIWFPVNLSV